MVTIMTPTYNRAYILPQAYQSLQAQTSFEFEWIVVDDGSTDGTEELVTGWAACEEKFKIVYVKQPNGGKHRAVNKGVALAQYGSFLILDSDDILTPDAVALVHQWMASIENEQGFAGVAGLRGYRNTEGVIGGAPKMKGAYVDATNLERRKYGLLGDKIEVFKTDVLRQYPFPEFEGENFLRESASWDRIAADGYKIRWYNQVIYQCEYLQDGLTKTVNYDVYAKNFQGYLYCTRLHLKTKPFLYRLLHIGHFCKVAGRLHMSSKEVCGLLGISRIKLMLAKCFCRLKSVFRS